MTLYNEVKFSPSDGQRPWPRLSCSQPGRLILDAVDQNATDEDIPTTGNLRVSGDVHVNGGLTTTGNLSIVGTANLGGNLQVQGNLHVTDFIDAPEIRQNGAPLTSSQWTNVAGGINYADGNVGIGASSPTQALEVNGAVKATNFIKGTTALVSSQWKDVAGGISYTGGRVSTDALTVNGAAELKKTLTVAENVIVEKNLTVKGATTLSGNVTLGKQNAALTMTGTLTVKGKTILEQEKWQDAPPMQHNWEPYGRGFNSPQYFKDSQGIVHLRGLIAGGTSFGYEDDGLVFTLPQGYRPSHHQLHVVSTYPNAYGRVDVFADGRVICPTGNSNWICLDSISFRSA